MHVVTNGTYFHMFLSIWLAGGRAGKAGKGDRVKNVVGCVVFVQNSRSLVRFRAEVVQGMCFLHQTLIP